MSPNAPTAAASGLLVVDKPAGWTSHDVVARCRRLLGQRRVGHAGTLDPGATGVLLVAFGRATRLMRFVAALSKEYTGEVVLGTATSTLDDEGEVTETWPMAGVTAHDARIAAKQFEGEIEQVPPMVSAVRVGGQRLYALARAGVEVERAARPVTVHRFAVLDPDFQASEPGVFPIEVVCSSGTYVRTLAADLGTALGGGAHLRRLRRTAIGSFSLDVALTLEELEGDATAAAFPSSAMVQHLDSVTASAEVQAAVAYGKPLGRLLLGVEGQGPWAVLDESGVLLAVYEPHGEGTKPALVL